MAVSENLYDLMVLLASDVEDAQRDQILARVSELVEQGGGRVDSQHDWGLRGMTFEIDHRPEAEYHLFQFYAPATALQELGRTLRITDGVLRFRLIKVAPGTPPPPEVTLAPVGVEE
jgi:small subunit ribosomal protein S6